MHHRQVECEQYPSDEDFLYPILNKYINFTFIKIHKIDAENDIKYTLHHYKFSLRKSK